MNSGPNIDDSLNRLSELPDAIKIAVMVTNRLAALGIRHFIGGSVASIVHGVPRLTQDVDLVADIHEKHVPALVEAFAQDFYIDDQAIRRAVSTQSSFNLIYLEKMHKVDVFIPKHDEWSQEVFTHAKYIPLIAGLESTACYLASAETIVLQKLLWFEKGGGVSDKQWDDILGVLKIQASALDYVYLHHWAAKLDLVNLLNKARQDAGQIVD